MCTKIAVVRFAHRCSVQWQIQYFPGYGGGGHQIQRRESQPILLGTFPQKLHENKKKDRTGVGARP